MNIVNGEWDVQKNVVKLFFKGLKNEFLERFKSSKKDKQNRENDSGNDKKGDDKHE